MWKVPPMLCIVLTHVALVLEVYYDKTVLLFCLMGKTFLGKEENMKYMGNTLANKLKNKIAQVYERHISKTTT